DVAGLGRQILGQFARHRFELRDEPSLELLHVTTLLGQRSVGPIAQLAQLVVARPLRGHGLTGGRASGFHTYSSIPCATPASRQTDSRSFNEWLSVAQPESVRARCSQVYIGWAGGWVKAESRSRRDLLRGVRILMILRPHEEKTKVAAALCRRT